jgi:ribosomal protein S18 acetylase RimI-like enzyme
VGFVHVRLDHDLECGALIDNLHVRDRLRRSGIGTRLLVEAGRLLLELRPSTGAYLWVQEQNVRAQGFYRARGGRITDRVAIPPPLDDPGNLAGAPFMLRVVWTDAAALLAGDSD